MPATFVVCFPARWILQPTEELCELDRAGSSRIFFEDVRGCLSSIRHSGMPDFVRRGQSGLIYPKFAGDLRLVRSTFAGKRIGDNVNHVRTDPKN
jgi:hypothetical protein